MNAKHTPEPWTYIGQRIFDANGGRIADTSSSDKITETTRANTQLIAVAPELISELKRSTNSMREAVAAMDICKWDTVHQVSMRMQIEINDKLIAKAERGPQ